MKWVAFLCIALAFGIVVSKEAFEVRRSEVQGVGVFAGQDYDPGEPLFLAIDASKTIEPTLGRKINHCPSTSVKYNSKLEKIGREWFMMSQRFIHKDEEITTDYNDTPDFILKPNPGWRC
jgi:hypothetical protein